MRVLVTGGAGYIGSISARLLLDEGHEVVVLDTLERGWARAVDAQARMVAGDIGDADAVAEALDGCSAVLHCAGLIEVAESQREPDRYFRANAQAPLVLLEQMRQAGIEALVFSSTAAVYGEPESIPITEEDPTSPVNAYGASKLQLEESLAAAAVEWGLRSTVFRYFNVGGAWPDGSLGEAHEPETHIIPRVLAALRDGARTFEVYGGDYPTRDGTCVRDYVHVMDLARAHAIGLGRLAGGGKSGTFNLGSGAGMTNREVVETCAAVVGHDVEIEIGPRREGDPATLVASSAKAERELGWLRERGDLATIVEDAWRWHVAHPNGYR